MRREVASLQSLNSLGGAIPSVCEHDTTSFEEDNVELFLVMEYVQGPTLAEYNEQDSISCVNGVTNEQGESEVERTVFAIRA